MMTHKEFFEAVREVIADETRWTKDAFARNAEGHVLTHGSRSDAICWCLMGAMQKVAKDSWIVTYKGDEHDAYFLFKRLTGEESPTVMNDLSTHTEVLETLDKAISL